MKAIEIIETCDLPFYLPSTVVRASSRVSSITLIVSFIMRLLGLFSFLTYSDHTRSLQPALLRAADPAIVSFVRQCSPLKS